MHIIKQKDNLKERYIEDLNENWTSDPREAKQFASKVIAETYIHYRGYKRCVIEDAKVRKANALKYSQTKCWNCRNATKCEWSQGKPVPDWCAIPTKIRNRQSEDGFTDSYFVVYCPKYEKINYETRREMCESIAKKLGCHPDTVRKQLKRREKQDDSEKNCDR